MATAKFERRFREVEKTAREEDRDMHDCTLEELDAWWDRAKKKEKRV